MPSPSPTLQAKAFHATNVSDELTRVACVRPGSAYGLVIGTTYQSHRKTIASLHEIGYKSFGPKKGAAPDTLELRFTKPMPESEQRAGSNAGPQLDNDRSHPEILLTYTGAELLTGILIAFDAGKAETPAAAMTLVKEIVGPLIVTLGKAAIVADDLDTWSVNAFGDPDPAGRREHLIGLLAAWGAQANTASEIPKEATRAMSPSHFKSLAEYLPTPKLLLSVESFHGGVVAMVEIS